MPYEISSHAADLRMTVTAETVEELFRDALRGMMHILHENSLGGGVEIKRTIEAKGGDTTALLVNFLNEALATAHAHKEVYTEADFKKFSHKHVEAELKGIPVYSFEEDIKTVTSHEADVLQNPRGEWETTLVFDI